MHNIRPAETFFLLMRPASPFFVKMWPAYETEFETFDVEQQLSCISTSKEPQGERPYY